MIGRLFCRIAIGCALLVWLPSEAGAASRVQPSDFGRSSDAPFAHSRADLPPESRATIVNIDTSESFATIQDAIDDPDTLDGHTLEVQGATHLEGQILVDKDITLRGQSGSEVVRMAVDTGNAGDNRGWFLVDVGIDLHVHDLTFDGNGRLVFQGFRHKGTGTFTDCRFQDIQYNAAGPDHAGTAIAVAAGDVTVTDCVFASIGRVGVLFANGSIGRADGCDYTGKGVGTWFDYAIEAGSGAQVTVIGNTARACRGLVPGFNAAGYIASTFFGAGTVADYIANTATDCADGIHVGTPGDSSTVTASYNRLVGNDFGAVSESPSVEMEDNWWGCNGGPGAGGCDPIQTQGSGALDADPWLVLDLEAVPDMIPTGGSSLLTADLLFNSDGVDTSGGGNVPDDIPVDFTGTLGSVNPVTTGTSGGVANSTFNAGGTAGTATVSATVDNQTVQDTIEIEQVDAIPVLDPRGLLILVLLLASAGWWIARR